MLPLFALKRPNACTYFFSLYVLTFRFILYEVITKLWSFSFWLHKNLVYTRHLYIEGIYILGKNNFRTRYPHRAFYT